VFLISTIAALVENNGISVRFWTIRFWTVVAAGETAAWRMKWIALPIAIAVLWSGARIIRSIEANPKKFIGLRAARIGFTNAAVVTILLATLIGITIPARLRQRRDAITAASYARLYRIDRALREYLEIHGTLPGRDEYIKELQTLPDPDGSIAEALRFVDPSGYQATTEPIASGKVKPLVQRGGALRNTTTKIVADPPPVSFTTYKLHLPSEHRFLGGDDDFVMVDGVITKASEVSSSSVLTRPNAP